MRRRKAKVALGLLLAVLFLGLSMDALAGIRGKIAGIVRDAETGEPLPAANVVIVGTNMGAATDADGHYFIINIPPGTYAVKASMVGYETVTKTEVEVRVDHTTEVNFDLKSTPIEGKEVVVLAEREIVPMDVSASQIVAENKQITQVPLVRDLRQYIGLQAGIEGLTIRGGSVDQTQFMVDGLTLVDNRANAPLMMVNLSAVKELNIVKGGFNAEYGNVRSGVVNVVTKEGSATEYHGSFSVRYRPPGLKHSGKSIFNHENYYLRPYLDPAVCWDGTANGAWSEEMQRQYPEFVGWNAIAKSLNTDRYSNNDMTPEDLRNMFLWFTAAEGSGKLGQKEGKDGDKPDVDVDVSFGGPLPLFGKYLGRMSFFTSFRSNWEAFTLPTSRDYFNENTGLLKLTSRIAPTMKLTVDAMYGTVHTVAAHPEEPGGADQYLRSGDDLTSPGAPYLYFRDAHNPFDVYKSLIGLSFDHVLSPRTYYSIRLTQIHSRNVDDGPEHVRDTTRVRYFGDLAVDEVPYGWMLAGPYEPQHRFGVENGMKFIQGGNTRDFSETRSFNFRADITSQIDRYNQIKSGVMINYDDMYTFYARIRGVFKFPEPVDPRKYPWKEVAALNPINRMTKWRHFPIRAGAYIQDKLEFEGMIANFGLRVDYSDPKCDWYTVDRYSPYLRPGNKFVFTEKAPKEPAKRRIKVSPRLGISHPISANSKLYFNYGHFYSMARSRDLYTVRYGESNRGIVFLGNPSADLPKTVAYELGYEHNIANQVLLHVAAYYKDVTDQTGEVQYTNFDGTIDYFTIENNNYEDIRGFELRLEKRYGQWITGWLNYNYMVRTYGYLGRKHYFEDPRAQEIYGMQNPYVERPIAQPFFRANVLLSTPVGWGPKIGPVDVLGSWYLGLLYEWKSGDWMTWDPLNTHKLQNNVQWKDYSNLDLRVSKDILIGQTRFSFYVDIANALNTKRLSMLGFSDQKDWDAYMRSLHLPMYDAPEYKGQNLTPGNDRPGDIRSDDKPYIDMPNRKYLMYSGLRRVYFGVRVSF